MKAYLLNGESQSIENIDVNSMEDIIKLIGYDTIESDEIGNDGDRLFFDEECFIRGTTGRFQIDTVMPVSGKAVLVGANQDGTSLSDVSTDMDDLRSRIKYL